MATIKILDTGRIDERESAFPMSVQLKNGDLLCSFGVGGGALITGQTEYARSKDRGKTWERCGVVLAKDVTNGRANALKLTQSADQEIVYAYGSWASDIVTDGFGKRDMQPLLCQSTDQGNSWSNAQQIAFPESCPYEVSHGLLPLESGRLLVPAATLSAPDRLGERVYLGVSDDNGESWNYVVPFHDTTGQYGYWEQKFAEYASQQLLGVCWTVTLGDYRDVHNTFVISPDGGETWSPPADTGIRGQTMTPIPLGGNRLLVLYNKRLGDQAIKQCLVTFTDDAWTIHHESILYDAHSFYQQSDDEGTGADVLDDFAFGFPTGIVLDDGTILTTHWCHEGGHCGIRWTRLQINW